MQSNYFRYHFGLEWEKRKIVRKVHAKCILQTAPRKLPCSGSATALRDLTLCVPVIIGAVATGGLSRAKPHQNLF